MAKIRHLAIRTKNPAKLAKYYQDVFGLEFLQQSPSGSIYLSDGYLNLAILRLDGQPSGLHHFGFQVDSIDEIEHNLEAYGEEIHGRPETRAYAEKRVVDLDGNQVDISVHGYLQIEYAADRERKKKVDA